MFCFCVITLISPQNIENKEVDDKRSRRDKLIILTTFQNQGESGNVLSIRIWIWGVLTCFSSLKAFPPTQESPASLKRWKHSAVFLCVMPPVGGLSESSNIKITDRRCSAMSLFKRKPGSARRIASNESRLSTLISEWVQFQPENCSLILQAALVKLFSFLSTWSCSDGFLAPPGARSHTSFSFVVSGQTYDVHFTESREKTFLSGRRSPRIPEWFQFVCRTESDCSRKLVGLKRLFMEKPQRERVRTQKQN